MRASSCDVTRAVGGPGAGSGLGYLVLDLVGSGSTDIQNLTDILTLCGSFLHDTPQIDRPADTVSPLLMPDNLDSRNRSKKLDSAEVACGTLTAISYQPARTSLAYGGHAGNWNVVDSSHERLPGENPRVM